MGAHSCHLTTTLVPFYNFIVGGKSAERAFPWALGRLTSLARWVFQATQEDTVPQGPGHKARVCRGQHWVDEGALCGQEACWSGSH